jgi:Holliday junction resolvase RusA-like endonuclease
VRSWRYPLNCVLHLVEAAMTVVYSFKILGAPRTKNKATPVRTKSGKLAFLPGKQYLKWLKCAQQQIPLIRVESGIIAPLSQPVEVTAVFYRDRNVGDQDNYQKGLGDFLQKAGIIKNDKLIHWTGLTRLDKDTERPRIEVKIECALQAFHQRNGAA